MGSAASAASARAHHASREDEANAFEDESRNAQEGVAVCRVAFLWLSELAGHRSSCSPTTKSFNELGTGNVKGS